jgi:hypothetical protein
MNIARRFFSRLGAWPAWLALTLLLPVIAGGEAATGKRPVSTVRGYLVDMVCVREEAGKLPDLGPKHSRKCLQMPACVESGYAILLSSNEVLKFDAHGNDLTVRLVRASHRDTGWLVKVTGIRQGDEIAVRAIELAPVGAPARKHR